MPDTFVTPSNPEQRNPPGSTSTEPGSSRMMRYMLTFAGALAGILISVLVGSVLAVVIVELGKSIYNLIQGNPIVFGLVAIGVVIGAILGGWMAYTSQEDAGIIPSARSVEGIKAAAAALAEPLPPPAPRTPAAALWQGIRDVSTAFLRASKAIFMLFANTVITLLPSTAFTTQTDKSYSSDMIKNYRVAIQSLPLRSEHRDIILNNWLGQISWADDRATRERNVNEIIRWWQILLGVLIPALTTASQNVAVGLMGIFVAFLTAIAQFRRPDENWRHYRILSENYQNEIWDFITLSGDKYLRKDPNNPAAPSVPMAYDEAFTIFHQQMTRLRKDDVATYFKDASNNNRPRNLEEIRKDLADYQQLFTAAAQGGPSATVSTGGAPGSTIVVSASAGDADAATDEPGSAG